MHVVISGMFWGQPDVGSGQYLHGLLGALARAAPEQRYTLVAPAYRGAGAEPPPGVALVTARTPFDGRSQNLAKLWFEQVSLPLAAARRRADVLHVPYFAPPRLSPAPVVATVLDIIPLRLPEYRGRPPVRAYMQLVAASARRANQIIAISEHSWGEIVGYLGCAPERVTAIPLAAGPQYAPQDPARAAALVAERYGVSGPFVYYVGGLDARKNVGTLVSAFARLRAAGGPPATLLVAGRALGGDPALFPDLDALIDAEGAREWVRRVDVPRADNPLLYSAAAVFAYPSRYEGFGLPPLEAMACGAPVVASDASSLPEVAGDAALLVPPDDVHAWTAALWRLLADADLRADLRRRGLERAALFSYDRVARETLGVYERAAGVAGVAEVTR